MPKQKGRGQIVRKVTIRVGKDKYKRCDIYEKAGPRGGKTVCGRTKRKKR